MFDCNVRLCFAMRSIGKAQKVSEPFRSIMNMPPPPATFHKYLPKLHQATQAVCETRMKHAGKTVKTLSEHIVTLQLQWTGHGCGVVIRRSMELWP